MAARITFAHVSNTLASFCSDSPNHFETIAWPNDTWRQRSRLYLGHISVLSTHLERQVDEWSAELTRDDTRR